MGGGRAPRVCQVVLITRGLTMKYRVESSRGEKMRGVLGGSVEGWNDAWSVGMIREILERCMDVL